MPLNFTCHSQQLSVLTTSYFWKLLFQMSPDPFPIICSLNITPPPGVPITKRLTRAVTSINASNYSLGILSSPLITHLPSALSDLVDWTAITLLYLTLSTNMHL